MKLVVKLESGEKLETNDSLYKLQSQWTYVRNFIQTLNTIKFANQLKL